MDVRSLVCGVLSAVALLCGTALAIAGEVVAAGTAFGLSGTFGGYVVGLYSQPYDGE